MPNIITNIRLFEQYSLPPQRVTKIPLTSLVDRVQQLCPGYDPHDLARFPRIYRGARTPLECALVNPSATQRRSASADNDAYNLLISASPGYPDRLRSAICTTAIDYAHGYGQVHVIVPAAGATIGVCPTNDVWEAFPVLFREFGMMSLQDFAECTQDLFNSVGGVKPTTLQALRLAFDSVDERVRLMGAEDFIAGTEYQAEQNTRLLNGAARSEKSLYDYVAGFFDLPAAGFKRFPYGSPGHPLSPRKEVWTDQPHIMVALETFDETFDTETSWEA